MNNKGPGDKKPNETDESKRRKRWQSALVGSQFAYTLVIATLLMGWIGHWLGTLLGGMPWTLIFMLVLGGAGFAAEMWRMLKFFSPKDDDDKDGPDGQSGDTLGTKFGVKRNDRFPDGPEGDIERGPYEDDDRRDNDDIERGGGDPERRGGDDIERPGEADDRPFAGGSPFGGLPGDGLSREELDEIIREIEGLTKVERDEIDRDLGSKPDGSPVDDKTVAPDTQPKPVDGKDNKNNNGSNE